MVLFLGVSSAVSIFTQVLLPVVKYLRGLGWRGLVYIDDSLTCERTEIEGLYWRFFAMDVFGRAGWVMNADKGQHPSQSPHSPVFGFCV